MTQNASIGSTGDLRHRVAFLQRAAASDGAGNYEGAYVTQFSRAARISPIRGGEEVMAQRLQGTAVVSVRVRSDSLTRTVDSSWQIFDVRKEIAYNVRSVANPDEKDIWLDFLCESGPPG